MFIDICINLNKKQTSNHAEDCAGELWELHARLRGLDARGGELALLNFRL